MLVRHTKSGCRSLPDVDRVSLPVFFLPQALTPELLVPQSEFPQRLAVRKKRENRLAALAVEEPLDEGHLEGRVLTGWTSCALPSPHRTGHELRDVEPQQGGREYADGRQDAEPSSDIGRYLKRRIPLLASNPEEVAFLSIRGHHETRTRLVGSQRIDQPAPDEAEGCHRLGRDTGLRDDVDDDIPRVQSIECAADEVRVDIVQSG